MTTIQVIKLVLQQFHKCLIIMKFHGNPMYETVNQSELWGHISDLGSILITTHTILGACHI